MISLSVRMVGWKCLALVIAISGKHGGVVGAWQEAITSGYVSEKISELRTQMAVQACLRRMRHLTEEERAAAICELTSEEWRAIEAAVMRSLTQAASTIAALVMLTLSGCASHEPACAFDVTARYTMTLIDAPQVEAMTNTLACLADQDTSGECAQIVPMCDGESLTLASPRLPDQRYTFAVVRADQDGIVARFEDLTSHTGYDVRLIESD